MPAIIVHWGATTQNIIQTAKLMMIRQAHGIFLGQFGDLLTLLAGLADATKDMAMPARTHGQHAVPATFGCKVSVWIDELARHVERLRGAEPRVFVAMLGGGVEHSSRSAKSTSMCKAAWQSALAFPPGAIRRAPSPIIWLNMSRFWDCSRQPQARSPARSKR